MSFAVLVGPSQDETTLLDEDEYRTLKCALGALRSENREANAILSALRAYTGGNDRGMTPVASFFTYLMADLADNMDEVQGILVQSREEPIFMRDAEGIEEAVGLKAFLKIFQSRNWLTDFFIPVRVEQYAEKTPTPLRVMQDLVESAAIFQSDVDDAKRMIREWPELFSGWKGPAILIAFIAAVLLIIAAGVAATGPDSGGSATKTLRRTYWCADNFDDAGQLGISVAHQDAEAVDGMIARGKAFQIEKGTRLTTTGEIGMGISRSYIESGFQAGRDCYLTTRALERPVPERTNPK